MEQILNEKGKNLYLYCKSIKNVNEECKAVLLQNANSIYNKEEINLIKDSMEDFNKFEKNLIKNPLYIKSKKEIELFNSLKIISMIDKSRGSSSVLDNLPELPQIEAKEGKNKITFTLQCSISKRFIKEYLKENFSEDVLDEIFKDKGFAHIYMQYRMKKKIEKFLENNKWLLMSYSIKNIKRDKYKYSTDVVIEVKKNIYEKYTFYLRNMFVSLKQFII